MQDGYDVVIIGGGPAGTTAGTLLAEAGFDVALCEKRAFPRFHIGESLIPAVNRTLARLGLLDEMAAHRYPEKHAVQFYSTSGKPSRPFYFSEATDPELHRTWQVLRSDFDALLLDRAVRAGVHVATPAQVTGFLEDRDAVSGVSIRTAGGSRDIGARVVVDASGQRSLLAQRLGKRTHLKDLTNVAVYAHYRDVRLDDGIDGGTTIIFRTGERTWIWLIPLPDAVSIGLVAPAKHVAAIEGDAADVLDTAIASCGPLVERLARAERVTKACVERDFSYRATRDGGRGWLLVGDALGFIDPLYSTGLFLSMLSAELAADAVHRGLRAGNGAPDLAGYSARWQTAFDRFLILVRAFYDHFRFGELAKDEELRRGLVDLLIGDVETNGAARVARVIGG